MRFDEKDLIILSLKEDHRAFGELVERYKDAIYHHCFSIIRDEDRAEDIAQETFITAYYKLSSFDQSRKFSTWLFKISTNKALNVLRQAKHARYFDDNETEKIVSEIAGPGIDAERSEVRTAVSELKPEYRIIVTLYYWEGKTYAEIADLMGKPEGSVKVWMLRAKRQLERRLR